MIGSGHIPTKGGHIACVRPAETKALNLALQMATDTHVIAATRLPQGGNWRLQGDDVDQNFLILPLLEQHRLRVVSGSGRLAVLVALVPASTSIDRLRKLYGLSAAEARLAIALTDGETLKHAADRFGISMNTARDQLKAVFRKVGVDRQSNLVLAVRTTNSVSLHSEFVG